MKWRLLIVIGLGILAGCLIVILAQDPTRIPVLISKLPPSPRRLGFRWYSQITEGVSPIRVPYNRAGGPWIVLEDAMAGFAKSNGIQIVRFEAAGSSEAYVCVRNKDAGAMRRFVRSMGQGANNASSGNRSQPVTLGTNSTPAAAGSGR